MTDPENPADLPVREGSGQSPGLPATAPPGPQPTVAPTGRREAFREIRRQLSEEDLSSRGVQKLLLDELERAEAECEILIGYVERFHEADKRAAVLDERVKTATALEIMFGVGIGVGGAIMGLAPLFWQDQPKGYIALAVGLLLSLGATIARLMKR